MDRVEAEMGRAAMLVAEIVDARREGDRDSVRGNSDDDLLGALGHLERASTAWVVEQGRQTLAAISAPAA